MVEIAEMAGAEGPFIQASSRLRAVRSAAGSPGLESEDPPGARSAEAGAAGSDVTGSAPTGGALLRRPGTHAGSSGLPVPAATERVEELEPVAGDRSIGVEPTRPAERVAREGSDPRCAHSLRSHRLDRLHRWHRSRRSQQATRPRGHHRTSARGRSRRGAPEASLRARSAAGLAPQGQLRRRTRPVRPGRYGQVRQRSRSHPTRRLSRAPG